MRMEVIMDEMKLKLSTNLMRRMVAKALTKVIFNKFGIRAGITVNGLEAEMKDGKIRFHIDMDGVIDEDALLKINRLID